MIHCAWVVLDGAPLLLAVVVTVAVGAPVWPAAVCAVEAGLLNPVPAEPAVVVAAVAGYTTNSFSIWLRSSSKSSRTSYCHPFSKSKKMYFPTSFWDVVGAPFASPTGPYT